jgi:hypothetical protein
MIENREITPKTISDDIMLFAADLGAAPPVYVTISAPPDAEVGDRAENIERQCRLRGGTPMFGRAIFSADDLYVAGEFHCVISTPQGLVDVTPSPTGETRTLFAAYPSLPGGAGLYHPSIRARVYRAAEMRAELELNNVAVAASNADKMSARKNGITVRQLLISKPPQHPISGLIDGYLRAAGKLEAAILAAHDGTKDWDPSRFEGLQRKIARVDRRRRELYRVADWF